MFQSAPLTGVRGDAVAIDAIADFDEVSIRSPHRSEGRWVVGPETLPAVRFQSAPLTGVRGDG